MSNAATAFGIYFGIGLLLMILAIATRAKEKGLRGYPLAGGGDIGDAWLLVTIALAWPIWTLVWLTKKEEGPESDRKDSGS
jgi:hypothetical protein